MVEGLPLVWGGEIHHHSGAPPEGRPAAGDKVVGSDGTRYRQVKVGMAVDEAREEQLSAAVHHPGALLRQICPYRQDGLPFYQYVRPAGLRPGNHQAPFQQCPHGNNLLCRHGAAFFWQQYSTLPSFIPPYPAEVDKFLLNM